MDGTMEGNLVGNLREFRRLIYTPDSALHPCRIGKRKKGHHGRAEVISRRQFCHNIIRWCLSSQGKHYNKPTGLPETLLDSTRFPLQVEFVCIFSTRWRSSDSEKRGSVMFMQHLPHSDGGVEASGCSTCHIADHFCVFLVDMYDSASRHLAKSQPSLRHPRHG